MGGFCPLLAVTLGWLALRHVHRYRGLRPRCSWRSRSQRLFSCSSPAAPPRLIPTSESMTPSALQPTLDRSPASASTPTPRCRAYTSAGACSSGSPATGASAADRKPSSRHPTVMVVAVAGDRPPLRARRGPRRGRSPPRSSPACVSRRYHPLCPDSTPELKEEDCPSTAGVTATSILKSEGLWRRTRHKPDDLRP